MKLRCGIGSAVKRYRKDRRMSAREVFWERDEGRAYVTVVCGQKAVVKEARLPLGEQLLMEIEGEFELLTRISHHSFSEPLGVSRVSGIVQTFQVMFAAAPVSNMKKPVSSDVLNAIALGLLEALAVLHELGICHNDISQSNVLWSEEDQKVRLVDLGMATPVGECGRGTIGYISPAMLRGACTSYENDLFGVGAVLTYLGMNSDLTLRKKPVELVRNQEAAIGELVAELSGLIGTERASFLGRLLGGRTAGCPERALDGLLQYHELIGTSAQPATERVLLANAPYAVELDPRVLDAICDGVPRHGKQTAHLVRSITLNGRRASELRAARGSVARALMKSGRGFFLPRANAEADAIVPRETVWLGPEGKPAVLREWQGGNESLDVLTHSDPGRPAMHVNTDDAKVWGRSDPCHGINLESGTLSLIRSGLGAQDVPKGYSLASMIMRGISDGQVTRSNGRWCIPRWRNEVLLLGIDSMVEGQDAGMTSRDALRAVRAAYGNFANNRNMGVSQGCQASGLSLASEYVSISEEERRALHAEVARGLTVDVVDACEICFHWLRSGRFEGIAVMDAVSDALRKGRIWDAMQLWYEVSQRHDLSDELKTLFGWVLLEAGEIEKCGVLVGSLSPDTASARAFWRGLCALQHSLSERRGYRDHGVCAVCGTGNIYEQSCLDAIRAGAEGVTFENLRGIIGRLRKVGEAKGALLMLDFIGSEGGDPGPLSAWKPVAALRAINSLCGSLWRLGSIDDCRRLLTIGLQYAERMGSDLWRSRFLGNSASNLLAEGDVAGAERAFGQIAEEKVRIGDFVGAARMWGNVGTCQLDRGEVELALSNYERQRRLYEAVGDVIGVAENRIRVGVAYVAMGAWGKAELEFSIAYDLVKGLDCDGTKVGLHVCFGALHLLRGHYRRAMEDASQGVNCSSRCVDEGRLGDLWLLAEQLSHELPCPESRSTIFEYESLLKKRGILDSVLDRAASGNGQIRVRILSSQINRECVDGSLLNEVAGKYKSDKVAQLYRHLEALSHDQAGRLLRRELGLEATLDAAQLANCAVLGCTKALLAGKASPLGDLAVLAEFVDRSGLPLLKWRMKYLHAMHAARGGQLAEAIRLLIAAIRGAFLSFEGFASGDMRELSKKRIDLLALERLVGEVYCSVSGAQFGVEEGAPSDVLTRWLMMMGECASEVAGEGAGGAGRLLDRSLVRILDIVKNLNEAGDLDGVLGVAVESMLDLCDAENGCIVMFDEGGGRDVRVMRSIEPGALDGGEGYFVSNTLIQIAKDRRKPVIVRNALDEESLIDSRSVRKIQLRSAMCAPLLADGRVVGVLYVDNRSASGSFTGDDLRLLEVFAGHAMIAISNTQMYGELERSYLALSDAQDKVVSSERLKVLGELASGVAHDFNNLLTAILVRAQLLQAGSLPGDVKAELSLIERAALDGAAAIRRIQDFTRVRRDRDFIKTDIGEALSDAVELTRPRWQREAGRNPRGIHVTVETAGSSCCLGNPAEIREVFTNIILNAVEAVSGDGRIVCRSWAEGDAVIVTIQDNGIGIEPEIVPKLFDPFFSTKGERGNGLGLSVAYGIVSRHQGKIEVDSKLGEGSTFRVSLPAYRVSCESRVTSVGGVYGGKKGKTVVVDDEVGVLRSVEKCLRGMGLDVIAFDSPEDALVACWNEDVSLVVSDKVMPSMDGLELVKDLRRGGYGGRILIMSGSLKEGEAGKLREAGVDGIISKPFSVQEFVAAVEQVSGGGGDRGEGVREWEARK